MGGHGGVDGDAGLRWAGGQTQQSQLAVAVVAGGGSRSEPMAKAKAKDAAEATKAPKAKAKSKAADAAKADEVVEGDGKREKMSTKFYEQELARLQIELVKLQEWIRHEGLKVVSIFEGRDAAGKGGSIKRITECLSPRSPAWWPSARRPSARRRSGISSATYRICRPPERWCCSTAVGTTGPGSNGSWASAPKRNTASSCGPARSSSELLVRSNIILIKFWFLGQR